MFAQLDGDQDGKVTKSELSSAIAKVADELNAQFDQSRVAKGGPPGAPPPGAGAAPPGAAGQGAQAASDDTTTSPYNAAADTNGDGTVSADEAAAYAKLLASGAASNDGAAGALNHALRLLKAYVDGDQSASTSRAVNVSA